MHRRRRKSGREFGSLYPTLDLHGSTADEARRKADAWLRRQRDAGERHVRVITGRGKGSVGPPVLRREIEELLRRMDIVGRVAWEAGAALVELRAAPVSMVRERKVPGELRRRAEESLAELGVKPTEELIQAEVRRIQEGGRKP